MLKGKQGKTHYLALFRSAYSDICFGEKGSPNPVKIIH